MKRLPLVYMLTMISFIAYSQSTERSLEVSFNKTTTIVFDYPVLNVDRGCRNLLAQRVKGTENAVQIKAASKGFLETNLTVFTSDGRLHHFIIKYSDVPATLTHFETCDHPKDGEILLTDRPNTRELVKLCERIMYKEVNRNIRIRSKFRVKLLVKGIYIRDNLIFYHLGLSNRSNLGYDIASIRFFVRDRKQSRRTTWQEYEVHPVYVYNDVKEVAGNYSEQLICALAKFTIPNAKKLHIELDEKNGGRNLTIPVLNRDIIRAKQISK